MPGDGATIFRDPIGKLDVLRIECDSIQPIVNINARCSWIPAHATRIKSGSPSERNTICLRRARGDSLARRVLPGVAISLWP